VPITSNNSSAVHEELAIAGCVALATNFVQPLKQRPELAKILQALNVFFPNCTALDARHAPNMRD
jgi:hypothetical protein